MEGPASGSHTTRFICSSSALASQTQRRLTHIHRNTHTYTHYINTIALFTQLHAHTNTHTFSLPCLLSSTLIVSLFSHLFSSRTHTLILSLADTHTHSPSPPLSSLISP